MERRWLVWAGVVGATAVVLGAFGAHALESLFEAADDGAQRRTWWETASRYHLLHAPALAIAGRLAAVAPGRAAGLAPWALLVGVAIFAGTLYAMALGAPRALGAVTPAGGLLLVLGWTSLAVGASRAPGVRSPG